MEILGNTAEQSLDLSAEALITIDRTIVVVRETVGTLGDGLATVEGSLRDASTTLENASNLFDVTADVAATDLPESIASVRQALPPLISSAESITDAIGALSIFGIDTGPTQPLAEPIIEIQSNLTATRRTTPYASRSHHRDCHPTSIPSRETRATSPTTSAR